MTEKSLQRSDGPKGPTGEWGMNGPAGPISIDTPPRNASPGPAGPSGEWGMNGQSGPSDANSSFLEGEVPFVPITPTEAHGEENRVF